MPFPAGMATVVCRIAQPIDIVDGENLLVTARFSVIKRGTHIIVWEATGQELGTFVNERVQAGQVQVELPAVDQDGFIDASGAPFSEWAYRVAYVLSDAQGRGNRVTKVFKPRLSDVGNVIDLGLLPISNSTGHPVIGVASVTKADVGLPLVDNTPDSAKPVSGPQQTALDAKTDIDDLLKAAARNVDLLIAGAVTRNSDGAATAAAVIWPDGTSGSYVADTLSTAFPGAVDAYHVTYGSPATRTYTQPAVTRDANGAVTVLPSIVVT